MSLLGISEVTIYSNKIPEYESHFCVLPYRIKQNYGFRLCSFKFPSLMALSKHGKFCSPVLQNLEGGFPGRERSCKCAATESAPPSAGPKLSSRLSHTPLLSKHWLSDGFERAPSPFSSLLPPAGPGACSRDFLAALTAIWIFVGREPFQRASVWPAPLAGGTGEAWWPWAGRGGCTSPASPPERASRLCSGSGAPEPQSPPASASCLVASSTCSHCPVLLVWEKEFRVLI